MYDPATGKWSFIAPMTCARVSACAVGYEDKVIVVGGYGRADNDSTPCPVLASTECYDPKTNLYVIFRLWLAGNVQLLGIKYESWVERNTVYKAENAVVGDVQQVLGNVGYGTQKR